MVRVTVVDGATVLGGTGTGRGAWCCPDGECLDRALRKGGFARALRTAADRIDPDALRAAFRNHGSA